MDVGQIIFTLVLATIFQCIILYFVITSATKIHDRIAIEKTQLQILIAMAMKAGVTLEEIDKILDQNPTNERLLLKEGANDKS